MRVGDAGSSAKGSLRTHAAAEYKDGGNTSKGFGQKIFDMENREYTKYLEGLRQEVEEQGRIVADKVNLGELGKYRSLIKELLGEVSSKAYAYYKSDQFDGFGRYQTFAIINKLNEKLEDMANEILKEQADNILLLQMVDDIRGLLVDLFL